MLHRFAFDGGRVAYRNRYVDTPSLRAIREQGKIKYSEFATDPCRSMFARFFTRFTPARPSVNPAVNVVPLDGKLSAVTEVPMPVQFDRDTLATAGVVDYQDDLSGQLTTAHPHQDPKTGELINYLLRFSRASKYRVYRQAADGAARRLVAEYPTDRPGYLHSFAITENHVVLAVFPLVANPFSFVLSGRPFIENYRWRPSLGTKFVVLDLRDGSTRGVYQSEAFFAFHHINAFEDGDDLVVDLCAYPDAAVIDALYLDRLRAHQRVPVPYPTRCRVNTTRGTVRTSRISEEPLELPRIDYQRCNGHAYRFAYGCGSRDRGGNNFLDQLVKIDMRTGDSWTWHEPGCYPGEPIFVPAPESAAEDDGVVLSIVLDSRAERSFMVTLDATSFTELARAEVPHAIPFGTHGLYSGGKPTS